MMTARRTEAAVLVRALAASVMGLAGRIDGLEVELQDGWCVCTCPGLPIPPFCGILALDPAADRRLAASLAGLVDGFDRHRMPPWLLLADGAFPESERAARDLGLTESVELPGMVLVPGELAAPRPVDAAVRRITAAAADRRRFAETAAAGFGIPPAAAELITRAAAVDTPGIAYYLADTAAGAAACAIGYLVDDTLGVYVVGTLPDRRRRGLGGAIVARAVSDGFARGARLAYLQSSPIGLSMYRQLGFREVSRQLRLCRPGTVSG